MQVKMPEELMEVTIRHMKVGEKGYTVPWAVLVEPESRLASIDINYTITYEPSGTTRNMLVERVEEGYIITVPTDYKFSMGGFHTGASQSDFAPIVGIKTS